MTSSIAWRSACVRYSVLLPPHLIYFFLPPSLHLFPTHTAPTDARTSVRVMTNRCAHTRKHNRAHLAVGADANADGNLDFDEFVSMVKHVRTNRPRREMLKMYACLSHRLSFCLRIAVPVFIRTWADCVHMPVPVSACMRRHGCKCIKATVCMVSQLAFPRGPACFS